MNAVAQTILVVDDDPAIRKVATRVLELHGYTVLTVATGEAAMDLIAERETPVDLILTDIVMPGMNGHELATWLGAEHPQIRVLFTSGLPEEAVVHRGALDAGTPFIEKPYAIADLVHRMREVLDAAPRAQA